MKLEELVKAIADDFQQTMNEGQFETFIEMKDCYDWDSKDIKNDVDYMCNKYFNITVLDNDYVVDDLDDYISYRKLISKVYAELKTRNIYK